MIWVSTDDQNQRSPATTVFYALILLTPAALVAFGVVRAPGESKLWYAGGAAALAVLGLVLFAVTRHRPWRNGMAMAPALAGLVWQRYVIPAPDEFLSQFVQGVLLLLAVILFAVQTVIESGGPGLRRARTMAKRLRHRRNWPETVHGCRTVPEVRVLRHLLREESAPILPLLNDPRPQVRVAALAVLEQRKEWRRGQPDLVLKLLQTAPEPEVRASAALALGGLQHRVFLEALAESLRDQDQGVRRAVIEALLWDSERRWLWVRGHIHDALADPRFLKDGPLTVPAGQLSPQALTDLMMWTTESGPLGIRATQTLSVHFKAQLNDGQPTPELLAQLRDHVNNVRASTVLRVELARLLHDHGLLSEEMMTRLLESNNPSPLRLLAVEAMLQSFPTEHAVQVLRDVAKQPNRELAMPAAIIVQKYLHIDLGLALGEAPPALHSRQAADVTRRVIEWARGTTPEPANSW